MPLLSVFASVAGVPHRHLTWGCMLFVAITAKRQSPLACFATQPNVQLCACWHAVELKTSHFAVLSLSHTIMSDSTLMLLQSNGMQTKSVSRPIGRKADVGIQSGRVTHSAAPIRVTMA
jgi:hypothetical protein